MCFLTPLLRLKIEEAVEQQLQPELLAVRKIIVRELKNMFANHVLDSIADEKYIRSLFGDLSALDPVFDLQDHILVCKVETIRHVN